MLNIMFDIETLGIQANSITLSIAAVKFEFGSDDTDVFSINIDPKTSKQLGMISDPDTIKWWKEQSPEALAEFMKNPVPIKDA